MSNVISGGSPRAVILDVDGTLIMSNDAHASSFVDAGQEMGVHLDFFEVRRRIGMGGDKLIPAVAGFEKESPRGRELSDRKGEIFRGRYLEALKPAPGARALVERIRNAGFIAVVASSASSDDLEGLLEQAGVHDLVQGTTSASDVEASKPEPDVVVAALREAGVPAERAVMIGDTPYDVEAASRAGVRLIGVRCGGWDDAALAGAAAVYEDPADLLEHFDDSPLGS
jgi:HAD superfamily hydrolase (TIGR01509 family)